MIQDLKLLIGIRIRKVLKTIFFNPTKILNHRTTKSGIVYKQSTQFLKGIHHNLLSLR